MNAKSGEGLSLFSLFVENFGWANNIAYNYVSGFPFSTWGEGLFIFVQNIILTLFIAYYTTGITLPFLGVVIVSPALLILSANEMIPFSATTIIFSAQILMIVGSRVPQIYENFRTKSTGQLSIITTFLQFAGSYARLFTIFQEVDD
eukprot:UN33414